MAAPAIYFDIYELVTPEIHKVQGEKAWGLFDQKLIDTIDFIREKTGKLITVNDWFWGGRFSLRGYRPKNCPIGADKSAHKLGKAADFSVSGMTANDVRLFLVDIQDELPHHIRIEKDVNWVHIDTNRAQTGDKIIFFNA